jgi:lambda family phage portal protein
MVLNIDINSGAPTSALGGLEGASTNSRRMASWIAPTGSADQIINRAKPTADDRGRDLARNDATVANVVSTHRNSIVGARYDLNANPDWETLGATEDWAEEFRRVAEAKFGLYAESPQAWIDAGRRWTLTELLRLGVASQVLFGEAILVAEWLRDSDRPYRTALQKVAPARLSNPYNVMDGPSLRRGIEQDRRGRPLAYHFRRAHPGDFAAGQDAYSWRRVEAQTPWGRPQVLHVYEALEAGQSRGLADLVAVLETLKMTKDFRGVTLENAVVNASYAAAIESELPAEVIVAAMGGGTGAAAWMDPVGVYLNSLSEYAGEANALRMDGVRIPHLFPGTKLNLKPVGTPGGVGTDFDAALLRHVAAGLGLSYEELSKDYSKTNYSSGRLGGQATERFMAARKKGTADRMAWFAYTLWVEEELNYGDSLPRLPGKSRRGTLRAFYSPLGREAFCRATWIGANAGQIDEMKETQAALMRIRGGLSTLEIECGRLGRDYREVLRQMAREQKLVQSLDLELDHDATRKGKGEQQQTLRGDAEDDE